VGPLPETLEQFGAMVHKDFPAVCDTKYMATCEGYCSSEASSLQVLSETLELLRNPTINLHPEHFSGVLHHNAGYDSFITARVLIKLITNYQNHLKFEKIGSQGITNARQKMVAFVNQMGTNHEIRALHGDSLVPDFQNNLWNGFKNRLRVNGTVEGIVVLEEEENGGVKLDTSNTEMDLL
jgi:DNA polymerase III epsilon subunit-like protein